MAEYPALPLWTDAYIADTMHMGCLESGAYLHLLMAAWRSPACSLPDDDRMLGRMARCTPREWAKVRAVVMNFWTHDDETKTWSQKRLLRERDYVRDRSERAKRAAEAKAQKDKETQSANALSEQHVPQAASTCQEPAETLHLYPYPSPVVDDVADTREIVKDAKDVPHETSEPEKREVRALCETYNAELKTIFASKAPMFPNQTNPATAIAMVRDGITADFARPVFVAVLTKMAANGKSPPGSLAYFRQILADAKAEANKPMPQGNADDDLVNLPPHLDARKARSTGNFDAAIAAARGIVAG